MRNTIIILVVTICLGVAVSGMAVTDTPDYLIVNEGEVYGLRGYHEYNDSVIINGTIELPDTEYPRILGTITLKAPYIFIGPKGKIDADGAGWHKGPGTPPAFVPTYSVDLTPSAGYGGHGGNGLALDWIAWSWTYPAAGSAYGDPNTPDVQMGSGGGDDGKYENPLRGGGAIKLIASDEIVVRGILTANGGTPKEYWDCWYGGGSGGGILVAAPRVILMGLLSAKGTVQVGPESMFCSGNKAPDGGGGRIKIFYEDLYRNFFATLDVSACEDYYGSICVDGDYLYWDAGVYPQSGTISIIDLKTYPFKFHW